MSFFDKLKNGIAGAANTSPAPAAGATKQTFTFADLPESLAQMQAMPEAALRDPFQTAALTVCALCVYSGYPQVGTKMLNWLRGLCPRCARPGSRYCTGGHFGKT